MTRLVLPTASTATPFLGKAGICRTPRGPAVPTEAVDNSVGYNKPCSFPCGLHVSQHTPLVNVRVVSFHTGVTPAPIKPAGNIDHVCKVRQKRDSVSQVSSIYTEQEDPQRWSEPTTRLRNAGTATVLSHLEPPHPSSWHQPLTHPRNSTHMNPSGA